MFQRNFCLPAMAGLLVVLSIGISLSPQTAAAGGPSVDSVLGIDQPSCHHVIDLLVRNRARRYAGHASPTPVDVLGAPLPGDLELTGVHLVSDGAIGQGPVFQISFRNTSRHVVSDFRISAVGVLERITPHSPCRSIRIPCINAGETKCIEMQLPARCMSMGPYGGQQAPFDTLIVAIDSLDELVECNELNNVAIIKRCEIPAVAVEAPATAVAPRSTDPGTADPNQAAPNGGAQPDGAPGDKAKPSPLENIDLDKLDLDDAQETAVRITAAR